MAMKLMRPPPLPDDRQAPPPAPQAAQANPASPLSPECLDQLEQARRREKKIRRAAAVAMVSGCTLAVFSAGSLLVTAVGAALGEIDSVGLIMGVALGLLAWIELRGRAGLLRFEPRACRVLGWNQLGLMALIIAYAAWMLAQALWGPNPYAEAIAHEPALGRSLGEIGNLRKMISLAVYGGLIAGTLIFQGLTSAYYFTRRAHVEAYLSATPEWVVQLRRRGATR